MRLTLILFLTTLLLGCASYENEVSELSDRDLCFEWMMTADMNDKAKISLHEIAAVRGISCSVIYGQSLVNQMKYANNRAFIIQAEAKRVQAEAKRVQRNQRIAARKAIASRQKEEASSTINPNSGGLTTNTNQNKQRAYLVNTKPVVGGALCTYSDGSVIRKTGDSYCPRRF